MPVIERRGTHRNLVYTLEFVDWENDILLANHLTVVVIPIS